MRRGDLRLRHLPLILGVIAAAAPARAHGPAPAVLEVLAADGATPLALRTNTGLALARGDGTYAYVCPARWDGNSLARAAASADGGALLVHSAGTAFGPSDGCGFEPLTEDALYVNLVLRWGDGFAIVGNGLLPDRSSILFAGRDGALRGVPFDAGIASAALAADGALVVAGNTSGATPRRFLGRLSPDGAWAPTAVPPDGPRVVPRASGDGALWLATAEDGGWRLWRATEAEPPEIGPLHAIVHGPVRLGERWLALFDGVLHEHPRGPGAWSAIGEVPWTCLQRADELVYACAQTAVLGLSDAGEGAVPMAAPVFSFAQLGVSRACGDEADEAACALEWAHYGAEAGWLDTAPASTPTGVRRPLGVASPPLTEVPPRGGCAVARSRAPAALAIPIAAWILRRTSRRTPSGASRRRAR